MGETIITGLKPGTDYAFQVTPINFWHVAGAPSVEVVHGTPEDTYAPPAPTIINTIAQGRHLHVAVDTVTAADFAGFEFHASTVNGFTPSSATLKQQGNSTTCEFMGTGDAQTWYIRVRSYDTSGNMSSYTAQASLTTAQFNPDDTTAPAVPTGLSLATGVEEDADGTQRVYFTAAWNANAEADLSHYELRYIKALDTYSYLVTPAAAVKVTGVQGNVSYTFSVRAVDRSGNASAWGTAASLTAAKDTTAPAAPTGLVASAYLGTIILSWTTPADKDVSHFNIYRGTSGTRGTAALVAKVTGTSFSDFLGTYGTQRYYWVAAEDTSGNVSATEAGPANATTAQVATTDIGTFAVRASQIWTKIPVLESDAWTNDSPTAGSVAWNAHTLYYNGIAYAIAAGNTALKYIYWVGGATAYAASDTNPSLGDGDFVIATNVGGAHDLAWNAIANQVIGTAHIENLAVTDAKVLNLSVDKLIAGTITSKLITLAVADGTGDSAIRAGKTSFSDTAAGFIIGIDDSAEGNPTKVNIGNASYWIKWTGLNLSWKGKNAELTEAGELKVSNVSITGGTASGFTQSASDGFWAGSGVTRVQMKPGLGFWAGADDFADAPFNVSCAGLLKATGVEVGGKITAGSGSSWGGDAIAVAYMNLAAVGWNFTGGFSVSTDADHKDDTVLWSEGTLTTANGGSYAIGAGNTGAMNAQTYIYFDASSPTVLQATATAANAVGSGKILVATAAPSGVTGVQATFQVFGGMGGLKVDAADALVANSITTGCFAADCVTANEIDVAVLSAISADMGTITAGSISSGYFRSSSMMTRGAYLTVATAAGDDHVHVSELADFPSSGAAMIIDGASGKDRDEFHYDSKSASSGPGTLNGIGSSPAAEAVLAHALANRPLVVPATKGIYISDSVNELRLFNDYGIEVCNIGIKPDGADYYVGWFGHVAGDYIGAVGISRTNSGLVGYNTYSGYGVKGIGTNLYGVYGTSSGSYSLYSDGDTYVTGTMSAGTVVDRTPFYAGDALEDIRKITGTKDAIDHESLPACVRTTTTEKVRREHKKIGIEGGGGGEGGILDSFVHDWDDVEVPGRDLGAMVSLLTVGMQQLLDRVEKIESYSSPS